MEQFDLLPLPFLRRGLINDGRSDMRMHFLWIFFILFYFFFYVQLVCLLSCFNQGPMWSLQIWNQPTSAADTESFDGVMWLKDEHSAAHGRTHTIQTDTMVFG